MSSTSETIPGFYIFGVTGRVKEIIPPSKAIVIFRNKGKEEKAILLGTSILLITLPLSKTKYYIAQALLTLVFLL